MSKEKYCILIDSDLINWVKEYAEKTGRTYSGVIEIALIRFKERMESVK